MQLAEIILVKIYGRQVLQERPWQVTETQTCFKIEGVLKADEVGGVAEIEISRANGRVLAVKHGK